MQIVIEIFDEDYEKALKRKELFGEIGLTRFEQLLVDGIPLPKGHGRLIDCSQLHLALDSFMYGINGIHEYIDDDHEVPTIIEADKAESEVSYADNN